MSEIAFDTIKECIGSLTENEAITVLWELYYQFGWSGTVFTRADVEKEWQESMPLSPGEEPGEMPDEVWDLVADSWEWRKDIPEILTERGWRLMQTALNNAIEQ
jgi:hypothetical protein